MRHTFSVHRLDGNPIISRGAGDGVGANVNGPSLIRAPAWVADPLGRYYLYFAHHRGTFIRLAVADSLAGPWRMVPGGALSLEDSGFPTTGRRPHIASPDVHVDEASETVRMYFHGHDTATGRQFTRLAVSADGIGFSVAAENLGPAYLRVFERDGAFYALGRSGFLYRSADGEAPFERGPRLLDPATRHVAVHQRGSDVLVFFSRIGDAPERILCCELSADGDWRQWSASEPAEVLAPEEDWEGGDLPVLASERAWVDDPVHQLRDPAVFVEDGETFLLYSVAGESGIAIARLKVDGVSPVAAGLARVRDLGRRADPGLVLARPALATLLAVLLSFGSALALRYGAGLTSSVEVLAVALAISLSRVGARPEHRGWRARALGIGVLPLVAVGASEVGTLLFEHPDLGDALFVLGVSATIYVRRFGDVARRVGTFAVLPLISVLIVPGPVVAGAGVSGGSGRWWAALVALIALGWVTVVRVAAVRAGWLTDDAVAPLRAPAARTRAGGGRRLSGSTRLAGQMALALGVSFALGRWLFGMHWSWMVLTAFIVSSGNRGREDVLYKGVLRVLGAAVGTLSATLIAGLFPAGDAWAIVVIFGVLAVALWLRPRSYAYWAAGMTAALALLYGYYGEHGVSMLADRLEGIVLGTLVAIAAALLLWPIRTTDVIRRDVGAALRALDRWLESLLDDPDLLEGEQSADPQAVPAAVTGLRRAVAALAPHLTLMRAIPPGLRARIDHLPALEALERVGEWIVGAPVSGRADPETIARLRGRVGELRSANGQGSLPEPGAWERLIAELEDLATVLRASEEAATGPGERLRGSTEKVLGYVNRVHGLGLVLGEAAGQEGPRLSYAVSDATGRQLAFTWAREREGDLPEPETRELARGRTPSGFPYAVAEPANAPSSTP